MRIRTLALADREAERAARWYNRQQRGLGGEFLSEMSRALELIESHPDACTSYEAVVSDLSFVRYRIPRFSYLLIFKRCPHELVLLAVAHTSRRPGYWMRRRG